MLPPPPPNLPNPNFDATAFHGVTPGTQVSFSVQAFCTPLDQREVLILVPPMPIEIE